MGIHMAKKRDIQYTEPWIKVVTALSIIGLVVLITTLVCFYVQRRTDEPGYSSYYEKQYQDKKRAFDSYNTLQQRWVRPLAPSRLHALEARVEIPLEIVRNNPKFKRPKVRQSFMRDRIGRLENNVSLLKQTQQQEKALENLNERIEQIRKMNIVY